MDAIGNGYDLATLAASKVQESDLSRRKLEMDNMRQRIGSGQTKEDKLREACEGFESVFIAKLWQDMRKSIPKDGYLHSKEEEQWVGMFDQEMAGKMAKDGGIGLKEVLFNQLKDQLQNASRELPSQVRDPKPLAPLKRTGISINGESDIPPLESEPASRPANVSAAPASTSTGGAAPATVVAAADPVSQANALASRIELEMAAGTQK